MPSKNRVIWREGLFIKPQHFQQQQRHNDYILQSRLSSLMDYGYGFHTLTVNSELLKLGRIGISAASGIMPDGTVFDIPHQDYLPTPIDVASASSTESLTIYLAIPMTNDALNEVFNPEEPGSGTIRYREQRNIVRDLHTEGGDSSELMLAQLEPRLLRGSDDLSAFTVLPLCRIRERRPDGSLVLDNEFIPTGTAIQVSSLLKSFLDEVAGTLVERARLLAERIGSPGQQGIADVAEFMMLQMLNRIHPLFTHYAYQTTLHPEALYRLLIQTCGELRTFTDESRLTGSFPVYNHDNQTASFLPLMIAMRQALSTVLTPRAIAIQLTGHKNGVYVATVNDSDLLNSAEFVLAVHADIPQEQLRRQLTAQTKVTTTDNIRDLVSVQLPGVPLVALSSAPRQLPYHAGYTYFILDQQHSTWKLIQKGTAIAFHVSGDFPGLDMQLWAIRSHTG